MKDQGGSASRAAWALAALNPWEQPQSLSPTESPQAISKRPWCTAGLGGPCREEAGGMGSRQVRTLGGWSFRAWGGGKGGEARGCPLGTMGCLGVCRAWGPSPASLLSPQGLERPLARHLLHQSPAHPQPAPWAPAPLSFNQYQVDRRQIWEQRIPNSRINHINDHSDEINCCNGINLV